MQHEARNRPAIPHGTATGYARYKCRCDACREAEVKRQREWREKLRQGKVRHRPNHPSCVPVRIRGQVYPSVSAAAGALGITPSSISRSLEVRGNAENAGLGYAKARPPYPPANSRPCQILGRSYPSIAAAARALGVSYPYLFRQMKAGLSDGYLQFLLGKMMQADMAAQGDQP